MTVLDTDGLEPAAYMVPVELIDPWEDNPRNLDDVSDVHASIKRFGFGDTTAGRVLPNGRVRMLSGHRRLKAAIELKLPAVPMRLMNLDEVEGHLFALAANKIDGDWSDDLAEVLADFDDDVDLTGLGWDDAELQELLDEIGGDGGGGGETGDLPEVPEVPESKVGEVYQLGPHRLVCGDSTDLEVWATLLEGERLQAGVYDPPYGMSYKGTTFGTDGLQNDGEGEWEAVLSGAVPRIAENTDGSIVMFFGMSRLDRFFKCVDGLKYHRSLTIYKPNGVARPWYGWIMTSESIHLFSSGEHSFQGHEDVEHCHDVYTFDYSERPDASVDHPTVKPLSIVRDLLSKIARKGWVVGDAFCGGGTTLIAAASLGMRARCIELDPRFCDVIRLRWGNYAREHNLDAGTGAL